MAESEPAAGAAAPAAALLTRIELHRAGLGLVPAHGEDARVAAVLLETVAGSSRPLRYCSCETAKKKTCDHLKGVSQAALELRRLYGARGWEATFQASLWVRLARLLFEGDARPAAEVRVGEARRQDALVIVVSSPRGDVLLRYLAGGAERVRFLERLGKAPAGFADRAAVIERLALLQASAMERQLAQAGMKTGRQAWEDSLWHRLAYHLVREHGAEAGRFHPSIDLGSGDFTLLWQPAGDAPAVQVSVARERVKAALDLLAAAFPGQADLAIHPVPLRSIFHVSQTTELDLEVRPAILALQASGEERYVARAEVEKFRYGRLLYLPELGLLAELEKPGAERKFRAPVKMRLERSQVPAFLDEHQAELAAGTLVLDEPLASLKIWKQADSIEITAEALERSWYWLSVTYGFGSQKVSLGEILRARAQGLPFLETAGGWVDLDTPALRDLSLWLEGSGLGDGTEDDRLRLPPAGVLRLRAMAGRPVEVAGSGERAAIVERLLELRPAAPYARPPGLATELRPYQERGVDWLLFLAENRLGGLLCDDMGLGKTHQAMALLACLLERPAAGPGLVVCPTSVLSHWRDKLRDHAPGLAAKLFHGPGRELPPSLAAGDVLVTSYGVLRRDAERLREIPFSVAVFDEIQHLKNRDTLAYLAAGQLRAEVRLGLSGTPVENSLSELKSIFDLVLPCYLGSDESFEERYGGGERQLDELKRLIAPFVLRRLKSAVLDELPAKIEDLRTCVLSDDQVALYRDAIATRGAELAERLRRESDEPLPYIHVFALLNLLKRICDHPALALGDLERAGELASGKWDLFTELLGEALDSGQKVVVFSQYLGMIQLFERHLAGLGVGFATLTGATTRRGERVDRFNHDPDCRVFLGSLKAGGTGIDLVGGSVVIHYDRWWNAAREDQATDRVYRIGQKRAVQVLKLVTEGTLEEKISAIIERKRRLAASLVDADDPHLAKIFTRDELLDLLQTV